MKFRFGIVLIGGFLTVAALLLFLARGLSGHGATGDIDHRDAGRAGVPGMGETAEFEMPQGAVRREREPKQVSNEGDSVQRALQAVNDRGDYALFRALLRSHPEKRIELLPNLLRIGKSPKGNEYDREQKLELIREFENKNTAMFQRLLNESLGRTLDLSSDNELVRTLPTKDWEAVVAAAAANNPSKLLGDDLLKALPDDKARIAYSTGMRTWLELDSIEASKAAVALPEGPAKAWAVESVIKWLREKGDNQAAAEWQAHLDSRRDASKPILNH